jgi:hypothetical protein
MSKQTTSQPTPNVGLVDLDFVDVNFQSILANDDDAMASVAKPDYSNTALPTSNDIRPFAVTLAIAVVSLLLVLSVGVLLGRCYVLSLYEENPTPLWRQEKRQVRRLIRRPSYREVV